MENSGHLRAFSTTGFRNAEFSKVWFTFTLIGSCIAVASSHVQSLVWFSDESYFQFWKTILSKLFFVNSGQLIAACILIYWFRTLERLLGTKKLINFLLITGIGEFILEITIFHIAKRLDYNLPLSHLFNGPYGALTSCFLFYAKATSVNVSFIIWKAPFSLVLYPLFVYLQEICICKFPEVILCMFQLIIGDLWTSILPALCATVSGNSKGQIPTVLYLANVFNVQKMSFISDGLASKAHRLTSEILHIGEDRQGILLPMGATAELQRQRMYEHLEEQQIIRQMINQRNDDLQHNVQPLVAGSRWLQSIFRRDNIGTAERSSNDVVDEERVATLISMGFTNRRRVIQVLNNVRNDINIAALILSEEASSSRG
ncbi:putative UBA/TS-N domain protein [Trichinella spiralis]|uniref:putative UBA/TS-N domain protein n=1 Tax=Trichinella spiralis TaxID=6334 RepID=UPI0001EFCBFF|nr:putative UBA/TS-N domain protein [Trichinella spiralis]